jgi:putative chitinase
MKMVSLEQILQASPAAKLRASAFVQPLNTAMSKCGITTPQRQAAFLAQIFHESGSLAYVEENLNYREEVMMKVWPRRFPTLAAATPYARNPEKLANNVYANRMGNGDESSGDGWKYRGAGLIQLTGKDNQFAFAMEADVDLLNVGGYLRTTEGACASSAWFWQRSGASVYADKGDFDGVSDVVNTGRKTEKVGDSVGYADRLHLYNAFKRALGVA